ncbi:MAG: DUF4382 domain-containing protein [Gammaproteobacteria bacterium]
MKLMNIFSFLLSAIFLSACGSGGSGSGTTNDGSFSLAVTDGPVDSAQEVWVQFDGVHIKPAEGEEITFEFEARGIDLLALQGDASDSLLSDETIPSGEYEWIRLSVSAELDTVFDSFIVLSDGTREELFIPSGGETGLKLVSGFTVAAGGAADFTIDFELRKSVTNPPGQDGVILRPALRLVDNQTVGTLRGSIASSLITQACENATLNDGAIYLYTGSVETASDMSGSESDPLTTALVNNEFQYEIGFLEEGEYTGAYTCDNEIDDPAMEDTLDFFALTDGITITADQETVVDFQ